MTLAAVTGSAGGTSFTVEILASATAANGIPSGASAGVAMSVIRAINPTVDAIRVGLKSTAGSGTMTATATLWGYAGGSWFVLKPLASSSAAPQTAIAIAENSTDALVFTEIVEGLRAVERIYLELVAIAGSSTAVTGFALCPTY